jgi:hypothetical protein
MKLEVWQLHNSQVPADCCHCSRVLVAEFLRLRASVRPANPQPAITTLFFSVWGIFIMLYYYCLLKNNGLQ